MNYSEPTTITGLNIYPIKSCRGIEANSLILTERGMALALSHGVHIHDREWMLISHDRQFLTQRQLPEMVKITIQVMDEGLWLTHPNTQEGFFLSVPWYERTPHHSPVEVRIWGHCCQGVDQGDAAAKWFTAVLGQWQGKDIRLLRFCQDWQRPVVLKNSIKQIEEGSVTTHFADSSPYLLGNRHTLEALNQRLKDTYTPVEMARFRVNIEIQGLKPWQEHRENLCLQETSQRYQLALPDPCQRCKIITIDPKNAEITDSNQPIQTLIKKNPYYLKEKKPYFAQKVILVEGINADISIGDGLEIV